MLNSFVVNISRYQVMLTAKEIVVDSENKVEEEKLVSMTETTRTKGV